MTRPVIEILAQIQAPTVNGKAGFTAGIVLWNDRVVEVAPIIHYMKKRKFTRDQVRDYCRQRGWSITVVHQLPHPGG